MKKKIKDITIAEVRRFCNRHLFCKECSLYKKEEELKEYRVCLFDIPGCIPIWMLDEEIEIPEEEVNA